MAFTQQPLDAPPYLVGPDQKAVVLNADIVRDITNDSHLNRLIQRAPRWNQYVTNERYGESLLLGLVREEVRTPEVLGDDNVYVGWSDYWASVISFRSQPQSLSKEEFTASANKDSRGNLLGTAGSFGFVLSAVSTAIAAGTAPMGVDTKCIPLSSLAKNGITQQLGLLQDDILYNLSLLCKNVLEPVKAKYPGITIVSGFRQVNTGIGQHERGQAADITIPSAPDTLIYEVADFIAKTLQFDQVILNYSVRRSPWIHVSFSSTGLRRTALTRDFDDTFHRGLFLITEKTGEDRAAALREQAEYLGKIDGELTIIESRHTALNPQTVIGDATAPGMGSAKEDGVAHGGGECGEPDGTIPNEFEIIKTVYGDGSAWDLTTHEGSGDFTNACVLALPGEWGHFMKHPGQTQHNGHAVDAIAYLSPTPLYNGKYVQDVDIIGSSGSTDAAIQWASLCAPAGNTPDGRGLDPNSHWERP